MIKHLSDTWKDVEEYTDIIFTNFFIGYKVHTGGLDSNVRLKILCATGSIASLMSWRGRNAGMVEEVKDSLEKLHTFIDKTKEPEDTILKNFKQVYHSGEELILENLRLSVETTELFFAQKIILKPGMYYAVTGDSGSGKSSFLSKIKGITYNGITASGVIKYPSSLNKTNEIILMPQKDFFPTDATLLEAIYYPKFIPLGQKEQIYSKIFNMLERLELCSGSDKVKNTCDIEEFMKSKKDWSSVLSGGQKKKVLLVSALMKEAKVLLLDEPFTGLHQEAIPEVQFFIKETLQYTNVLVICIDHHISDSINFYDFELRIENKVLELRGYQLPINDKQSQPQYEYQEGKDVAECGILDTTMHFFNDTCLIGEN